MNEMKNFDSFSAMYANKPLASAPQKLQVEMHAITHHTWHVSNYLMIFGVVQDNLCSTQEEILVSTEIEFDISLVLKKSCLRKLVTSPRKLLYYLVAVCSLMDADEARTVDKQLITDLMKTSF